MKKLMMMALIMTIFTGCNWVELNDDGSVKAWWVTVEVGSGYPEGVLNINQVKESDEGFEPVMFSMSIGGQGYDGEFASELVRIKNVNECTEVCGFIEAWICSEDNEFCSREDALHDFGIVEIDGMLTEL